VTNVTRALSWFASAAKCIPEYGASPSLQQLIDTREWREPASPPQTLLRGEFGALVPDEHPGIPGWAISCTVTPTDQVRILSIIEKRAPGPRAGGA